MRPRDGARTSAYLSMDEVSLPLNRVRRAIKQDTDIHGVQAATVSAVGTATKLFVAYFAEQAQAHATETGHKRLQYSDFAEVVAENDDLQFLSQVVPRQVPFGIVQKKRAEMGLPDDGKPLQPPPEEFEDETLVDDEMASTDDEELEDDEEEDDDDRDDSVQEKGSEKGSDKGKDD